MWCFTDNPVKNWGYCKPLIKPTEQNDDGTDVGTGPSLWGVKGVQPAGVRQGSLGDCWFLAVGSALAENPERVRKLFTNVNYPQNGAFKTNMFVRGEPISIIVDDWLPIAGD